MLVGRPLDGSYSTHPMSRAARCEGILVRCLRQGGACGPRPRLGATAAYGLLCLSICFCARQFSGVGDFGVAMSRFTGAALAHFFWCAWRLRSFALRVCVTLQWPMLCTGESAAREAARTQPEWLAGRRRQLFAICHGHDEIASCLLCGRLPRRCCFACRYASHAYSVCCCVSLGCPILSDPAASTCHACVCLCFVEIMCHSGV